MIPSFASSNNFDDRTQSAGLAQNFVRTFFDFYNLLKISNQKFSKANLGYLDTFFWGMLESKLALNNLNFKCYIQFFCQSTHWA